MYELNAGLSPLDTQAQRWRDMTRQRQMTLADLLLENRIIFFGSAGGSFFQPIIDDVSAISSSSSCCTCSTKQDPGHPLYINSPGGSVTATLAIYDTMQFLECPIATYCMGIAASGAAILLAAGTKGKRFALPHARSCCTSRGAKSAARPRMSRSRSTRC